MARVTVEDCIDKVENRFDLVLLASHRARLVEGQLGAEGVKFFHAGRHPQSLFEFPCARHGHWPGLA